MFKYYNANPKGLHVHDCTIRAISLATGRTWDSVYQELSTYARLHCVMPDDVNCIDDYLNKNFEKIYYCDRDCAVSVGNFIASQPKGVYLITMSGHITCCIDGVIYDTFDCRDRVMWCAWEVID